MGVRDVFEKSYSLLRCNLKESLLIGIAFWLIIIAVEGSFFFSGAVTMDSLYSSDSVPVFVMNFIVAFIFAMFSGGIYYALTRVKRKKIDLLDIRKGIEIHWQNLLKAFILLQVIVFAMSLVLDIFIDGSVASAPAYSLLSVVLVSAVLLLQISLMFVLIVVVIEKMDGFRAVKISVVFFKNNVSLVLKSVLLLFLLVFAIAFRFMLAALVAGFVSQISVYLAIPIVLAIVLAFIVFMLLAYFYLSVFVFMLYKAGKRKK